MNFHATVSQQIGPVQYRLSANLSVTFPGFVTFPLPQKSKQIFFNQGPPSLHSQICSQLTQISDHDQDTIPCAEPPE